MKKTFSGGDKFTVQFRGESGAFGEMHEAILIQVDNAKFVLADVKSGNRYENPVTVKHEGEITIKEFSKMINSKNYCVFFKDEDVFGGTISFDEMVSQASGQWQYYKTRSLASFFATIKDPITKQVAVYWLGSSCSCVEPAEKGWRNHTFVKDEKPERVIRVVENK